MATVGKLQQGNFADLATVSNNTAVAVGHLVDVVVAIGGTFSATAEAQASFDGGTTWVTVASGSVTAPALVTMPRCGHIRTICSARVSGTIKSSYGGTDTNRLA